MKLNLIALTFLVNKLLINTVTFWMEFKYAKIYIAN